ncbi:MULTISPECIES: DNA N-6-adenine-methyltransferase [unclassified Thioalkalivibrio]|uniref:DNA N-6-adenine-methyltransferase n=1 Tax=unclassified Thioalkalivibrio TaxID=2621013 RepID=UPI0003748E73|nr:MULTISPECIES: DNA N-6-adenine-methyltransferase [unclassified Thioalkalivibrio]
MAGMGSHQSTVAQKDEWLTPPKILHALGPFDLDPCAPVNRPWPTANEHLTVLDNGLTQPWRGRVWLNPPYGDQTGHWLERLVRHGDGVALIFARTETAMFFEHVWARADALLFLRSRLHFHHVSGERSEHNSGAPSVLIAYGEINVRSLKTCGLKGHLVPLNGERSYSESRAPIRAPELSDLPLFRAATPVQRAPNSEDEL